MPTTESVRPDSNRITSAYRLLAGDKEPVRLASSANLALSGLLVVDGVQTVAGDRVLVKNQTNASRNGIYTASAGAWYRTADANRDRLLQQGMKVHVREGTLHGNQVWMVDTHFPNIGTDDIEFDAYIDFSSFTTADYATVAIVAAASVPAIKIALRTAGYAASGDGGAALYDRVASEPSHAGKIQSADGAWWELAETAPNVAMFGATGSGSDEVTALQNTINYAYAKGGRSVSLIPGATYLVDSDDLTIYEGVNLKSDIRLGGDRLFYQGVWLASQGGIRLNTARTIRMRGHSKLQGVCVGRKGLVVPAANSSAFAGRGVTVAAGNHEADIEIQDCMFLGLAQAWDIEDAPRLKIKDVLIDCLAGGETRNCGDAIDISHVHGWPIVTVGTGAPASDYDWRSGSFLKFLTNVDGGKVHHCFSHGYANGYWTENCAGLVYDHCSAEGTNVDNAGDCAFRVVGSANKIYHTQCQGVGVDFGMSIESDASRRDVYVQGGLWSGTVNNFRINQGGALHLHDADLAGTIDSIVLVDSNSLLDMDGNTVGINSGAAVANNGGSLDVYIGDNNRWLGGALYSGIETTQSVASAAGAVALPTMGSDITITGSTGPITSFTGGYPGRIVRLRFASTPTITASASIRLNAMTDFVARANDTLVLKFRTANTVEEVSQRPRIGFDVFTQRTLTAPTEGLSISNADGTGGNPTFALANDLAALENMGSAGFAVRTATDTWAPRSLAAPAAGLAISNPAGTAGNPAFSLANDLAALEALSGTNTIYYRSASDTWTAVSIGSMLQFSGGSLNTKFRGALATNSLSQSIANITNTILAFNQEGFDTDTIHDNVTNNSRMTVPAGVSKVRIGVRWQWQNLGTTDNRVVSIYKNGAAVMQDVRRAAYEASGSISGLFAVSPGDYFQLNVYQESGGALNISGGDVTAITMEIVE